MVSGYQFAPLNYIFDVKHDLWRKDRLVIGGHVVDASEHESYSSNMKTVSMRILHTIAAKNKLGSQVADISNAYLYAKTCEKIYTVCGKQFDVVGELSRCSRW